MKKIISVRIMVIVLALSNTSILTAQTDSLLPRVFNWDSLTETKTESRITRPIMEGSTTSLSHFEVHATTLLPGKEAQPRDTHADVEELIIIKEGMLEVMINDTAKILEPGSIAFVMPGDEHVFNNNGNTNATYYVFKYQSKLPMNIERAKQNGSLILNWNDLPMAKTEKGGRREFFNRPTSQLAKFEMHTTMLNTGQVSHDPHRHVEEEIILILKGNVQMQIGDNFYKASAGDLVFLSSGVLHALKNIGDVSCEYFAFQWR